MATLSDPRPMAPSADRRRGIPRWVELLPAVALVVAFGVKAAVSPNSVRDVFSNVQAFLLAGAIFGAWLLVWLVVLPRFVQNGWMRFAVMSALTAILVVALVVPSLHDTKIVEALPKARAAAADDGPKEPAPTAPPAAEAPVQIAHSALVGIDVKGLLAGDGSTLRAQVVCEYVRVHASLVWPCVVMCVSA